MLKKKKVKKSKKVKKVKKVKVQNKLKTSVKLSEKKNGIPGQEEKPEIKKIKNKPQKKEFTI